MWGGSRSYLRETNLDVIAAEAIIWSQFLLGQLWKAEKDREMFERMGYATHSVAARLALGMIESATGVNFADRARESRKLYLEAAKDRSVTFEPFATTVLRSVGCRSLAEPLKATTGVLPPPEWTPIALNVGVFYSTIPSASHETFKNMLKAWPDRFPSDDDFDDE